MADSLEELIPFLKNDARIELKSTALANILSKTKNSICIVQKTHDQIIQQA